MAADSEVHHLRAHILDLERRLGKKTIEAEILKEALERARTKMAEMRLLLVRRGTWPPPAIGRAGGCCGRTE
jgi:hypothetical protein